MPSNISIFENIGGTITNYYLSGATDVPYAGSGTPWTALATTPIRIGMNDATGPLWTPQAPGSQAILSSGPPFVNGSTLVSRAYPNKTEAIPIQIYGVAGAGATAYENAVVILQRVRRALASGVLGIPPLLRIAPDGAANAVSFEIVDSTIQESPFFINTETGRGILRAVMTLTLKPFGGNNTTTEQVIAATTVTNTGTGSPNNVVAYGTGTGDMINEGGPLNIRITPITAAQTIGTLFCATIISRTYQALTTVSSSATLASPIATITGVDFTAALTRTGLKARFLWRLAASGAGGVFKIAVRGGTGAPFWTSTLVQAPITGATILDFGEIPLGVLRQVAALAGTGFLIDLYFAGSSSTSAAVEVLLYYDFARITDVFATVSSATSVFLTSFQERNNFAALPLRPNAATVVTSTVSSPAIGTIRGQIPRYYPGTSLYLAWLTLSNDYSAADQATVSVKHAPLYHTLRGTT